MREANLKLDDFTLIVGDNSLGKTILLESYSLYSNVMKERIKDFMKWKYIQKLSIENGQVKELLDDELYEGNIKLFINFEVKDEKSLRLRLINYKEGYIKLLKEKILNSNIDDTEVEINYNVVSLDKFPKQINLFFRKNYNFIEMSFEDRKRRIKLPKIKDLGSADSLIDRIRSIVERVYNRVYFEKLCGIEELIFFPSERNIYKANAHQKSAEFIEDSFSQMNKDNEMRYSESLFVKSYFEHLSFTEFAEEDGFEKGKQAKLYELLCKSLGGRPLYEDGIVTSIKQKDGVISEKLFSTKQNRMLPYFMLCTFIFQHADRIIIEEPEAHMSLKSMFELVEITDYLLKRKNLIMTSHSDVFVTLLNNLIKKQNINARVYELVESHDGSYLKEVIPGDYGYELSFMSEQIIRLNEETLEAFKDVSETDESI